MADVTEPCSRTAGMGLIAAAYGLGTIAGAALAWTIGSDKTVLAFVLVAVFLGSAFVAVFLLLPESRPKNVAQSIEHERPHNLGGHGLFSRQLSWFSQPTVSSSR